MRRDGGQGFLPATPDEAPLLTAIAHAAKRHWGYPEHWMAQWNAALTMSAEYIACHRVVVAERSGEVLGFFALEDGESCWFLEHLWVRPDQIGKGCGARLFDQAMSMVRSARPGSVFIDSDPNAEAFYLKMGARRVGSFPAAVGGTARALPRLEFVVGP